MFPVFFLVFADTLHIDGPVCTPIPHSTTGHMKCRFDGGISQQDVIFLNLYKRVYPKWTYSELAIEGV